MIGVGEPALPGISLGHNGADRVGLTIFNIDQEDLYVYETESRGRRRNTASKEGWEPFRVVRGIDPGERRGNA